MGILCYFSSCESRLPIGRVARAAPFPSLNPNNPTAYTAVTGLALCSSTVGGSFFQPASTKRERNCPHYCCLYSQPIGQYHMVVEISTSIVIALILFIMGLVAGVSLTRPKQTDPETLKRIEVAEARLEKQPEKTGPAWELARVTLEQYFSRNLEQVRRIFYISLGVMILVCGRFITSAPNLRLSMASGQYFSRFGMGI